MDSPLCFRHRNTLHPMTTRLELEPGINILSNQPDDHFTVTAQFRHGGRDDFDFPAVFFRKACIHPEQIGREKRRFIPAGTCADFQIDVLAITYKLIVRQNIDFNKQIPIRATIIATFPFTGNT